MLSSDQLSDLAAKSAELERKLKWALQNNAALTARLNQQTAANRALAEYARQIRRQVLRQIEIGPMSNRAQDSDLELALIEKGRAP